jgi:hypothetical protein
MMICYQRKPKKITTLALLSKSYRHYYREAINEIRKSALSHGSYTLSHYGKESNRCGSFLYLYYHKEQKANYQSNPYN